jgi:hypothetical protein
MGNLKADWRQLAAGVQQESADSKKLTRSRSRGRRQLTADNRKQDQRKKAADSRQPEAGSEEEGR